MELLTLTLKDKEKFNAFVAAAKGGSFLQSWDWGEWQHTQHKTPYRYLVREGDDTLLAGQVFETSLPVLTKPYHYIPHGPVLKTGLNADTQEQVLRFFFKALEKSLSSSVFFRVEPPEEYSSPLTQLLPGIHKTRNIQAAKTILLDLRQSPERLLEQMHSKTRYNIKVALRHGVEVVTAPVAVPGHGLYLKESVALIAATAKRQHYKDHGTQYYMKLIDFFGPKAKSADLRLSVYQALYKQALLATGIMLDFAGTRMYLFGGSATEHRNVMAPYALHWYAIQDAQKHGLSTYDFGGSETAGGKDDFGFTRFKLGFGGEEHSYPGAFDLVTKPLWYTIYTISRRINRIRNKML